MPMEMENRVMKIESEMRVLRAAIAQVPQSILRELTARGALLVVKAPPAELEEVVGKEILTMEEMESEEEEREVPAVIEEEEKIGGAGGVVAVVSCDEDEGGGGVEERPWAVDAVLMQDARGEDAKVVEEKEVSSNCSSGEDGSGGDSSDEETATPSSHEDHPRTGVETSQESVSSDTPQQSTLSLSDFDEAVAKPLLPTPAVLQRPQLPFALPPSTALPLRPLVLARRPVVTPPSSSHPSSVSHTQQVVTINLPAGFEVQTKDSVGVAWAKWCCGDAELGLPPFRRITSKHVANKVVLRRLSDLRCAMAPIETLAKERALWSESLTLEEAARIYKELAPLLPLSQAPTSGRKRTRELAWSTALNIMRRGNKRKQPATDANKSNNANGYVSEALI